MKYDIQNNSTIVPTLKHVQKWWNCFISHIIQFSILRNVSATQFEWDDQITARNKNINFILVALMCSSLLQSRNVNYMCRVRISH